MPSLGSRLSRQTLLQTAEDPLTPTRCVSVPLCHPLRGSEAVPTCTTAC